MSGPDKPGRTAPKKAATNWGAVVVFITSSVTMGLMAHSLDDGSELKSIIVTGFLSFVTLFVGYWFKAQQP
jgi:hypothetical protein